MNRSPAPQQIIMAITSQNTLTKNSPIDRPNSLMALYSRHNPTRKTNPVMTRTMKSTTIVGKFLSWRLPCHLHWKYQAPSPGHNRILEQDHFLGQAVELCISHKHSSYHAPNFHQKFAKPILAYSVTNAPISIAPPIPFNQFSVSRLKQFVT